VLPRMSALTAASSRPVCASRRYSLILRMRLEIFLHHARYFEIGIKLLRQLHVTTAASLQIALMRRSIHRRDVEDLELTGLAKFFS